MSAGQQEAISILSENPIPSGTTSSTEVDGLTYDHLKLYITLTIGSLTNLELYPETSPDGGTTWFKEYDTNLSQIQWDFTASATEAVMLGQDSNVARMTPWTIAGGLWRLTMVTTGTPTGSSITVDGQPFNIGAIHDR